MVVNKNKIAMGKKKKNLKDCFSLARQRETWRQSWTTKLLLYTTLWTWFCMLSSLNISHFLLWVLSLWNWVWVGASVIHQVDHPFTRPRVVLIENSHGDVHDRTRPSLSSVPVYFFCFFWVSLSFFSRNKTNKRPEIRTTLATNQLGRVD